MTFGTLELGLISRFQRAIAGEGKRDGGHCAAQGPADFARARLSLSWEEVLGQPG